MRPWPDRKRKGVRGLPSKGAANAMGSHALPQAGAMQRVPYRNSRSGKEKRPARPGTRVRERHVAPLPSDHVALAHARNVLVAFFMFAATVVAAL